MENMPIILISARNESSAAVLISEIIDNNSIVKDVASDIDTIWKLINKYYTANVRVHVLIDEHLLEPELKNLVEAHIIFLTTHEVDDGQYMPLVEKRCHASSQCPSLDVRLLVTESKETAQLQAAAITSNIELVSLQRTVDDGEDADGEWGAGRIREALQAHLWPSAQLLCPHLTPDDDSGSDSDGSSDDSWSSWQAAEGEEGGEECAEAFEGALRSLAGAAASARALREGEGETEEERWAATRTERLARAEALVAAFCHALGPSTR